MAIQLTFTGDQLSRLSDRHITRFERLLASDSSNIKPEECRRYLATWRRVKSRVGDKAPKTQYDVNDFPRDEKGEIVDAYTSESYIDILGKCPEDA